MMHDWPLLSMLIWGYLLAALLVALAGDAVARTLARGLATLLLLLSLPLWTGFDGADAGMQFVERHAWLPDFGVDYALGIDGIALPLILLTTIITWLVTVATGEQLGDRPAIYLACFLAMAGFMVGVFAATDAILFYVFWEGMLIPMFLVIGIWGGPRRVYATIKFFLYTFLGSVFMLVALIWLHLQTGSFAIADFHRAMLSLDAQQWLFVAFLLAFAVKIPMWPVHTWLPDAHVEAPTGGSAVLAAVMLKMGAYGFLRFSLPIAPDAAESLAWVVIGLSLVAVVYIGFVALVQEDLKKLIAYSSIAHMGFVTLGLFIALGLVRVAGDSDAARLGVEGAVVQMISHGFISAAMFFCVGVLYERMHTRLIADYGGVVNAMPAFAALSVFFAMANAGLPGTSGFVGEFMVILASFAADPWLAFFAATTLILGAAYTLWMVKRVFYGEVASQAVAELAPLVAREKLVLGVLAALVLLLGVWPDPLVAVMHGSVDNLLAHIGQSKLPALAAQ